MVSSTFEVEYDVKRRRNPRGNTGSGVGVEAR